MCVIYFDHIQPHYPLLFLFPTPSSFPSSLPPTRLFAPPLILGEPVSLIRVPYRSRSTDYLQGQGQPTLACPLKKNASSSLSNPQLPRDPQEGAGLVSPSHH